MSSHTQNLTDLLASGIRQAILDRVDAGDFTVADIAGELLLPIEVTEALCEHPEWSMDLCSLLCDRFDIEVQVIPVRDAAVTEPKVTIEAERVPVPEYVRDCEPVAPRLGAAPALVIDAAPVEDASSLDQPIVPKPCPPRASLHAVPPLMKRGEHRPTSTRAVPSTPPGTVNPVTGLTFVHLGPHAMDRAEEMHLNKQKIIEALQPKNIVLSHPDPDLNRRLIVSATEPDLMFVVNPDCDFDLVSVMWKSDEMFRRPTKPGDPDRPPPPQSVARRQQQTKN